MRKLCENKFYFLLCIGVIWLLIGCSKEPEPHSIINVGDQFEIKLHQILSEAGGIAAIQVNSLEPQDCSNSYISHQIFISEEWIRIILDDILVEGDCVPGTGIVREEILLNTPKSALPIEINLQNAIANHGTFYSDESEIEMVFSEFDGLKISKTHLNRIRPKMIWGSFSISKGIIADQLDLYLQNLDNINLKMKGDYGHFYLSYDDSVIIYGDESENEFSFFISTDESFDNIKAKFQQYKELDASLVLKVTNYDGSTLNIH